MPDKPDLDAAYDLTSPEDSRKLYAEWAGTYDADFAGRMGYLLPERVVETFVAAGGAGPVLDIGAGTGLAGVALAKAGIGPVDATDISPEMLAVAAEKRVHRRLFAGDVAARLDVAEDSYAGVISAGTFTHGHVGPEALGEVLRVAMQGALIALSINAQHWQAAGFEKAFEALSGRIADLRLPSVRIYGAGATGPHRDDTCAIALFRKA